MCTPFTLIFFVLSTYNNTALSSCAVYATLTKVSSIVGVVLYGNSYFYFHKKRTGIPILHTVTYIATILIVFSNFSPMIQQLLQENPN